MRTVVSSAAEAELGALFHNGKEACPMRVALQEMGHAQPPTPIVTDNSTASGIVNDTVKQKRSKAVDMRFYWIRDRVRKGEFIVYWRKGATNKADYFTKHHSPTHHRKIRSTYLHDGNNRNNGNYFDCLRDDDENNAKSNETTVEKSQIFTDHDHDGGEGVLNTGHPDSHITGNPVSSKIATDRASSIDSHKLVENTLSNLFSGSSSVLN